MLVAADLAGTVGPEVLRGAKKILLALGNEAAGLSKALLDMADYRLRIPVDREKAESLNVAACGAILMYLSA
jgi:TrmH family RNA methyltransferase